MTTEKNAFSKNGGFTLIELVMTILILGMVSLILIPYIQSIIKSPEPVLRERAVSLAQSMMDEILAKKWDSFTPTGGGPIQTAESNRGIATFATSPLGREAGEAVNDRSNWDDVDDFNGHSSTDNFKDQNNNGFTLKGYSRSVQVDYIASPSATIDQNTVAVGGSTTDTKRIMVTVTAPNGESFTLVAVACNL